MDPNQTVRDIAEAAQEGDWATVQDRVSDLCNWLGRGGFEPTLTLVAQEKI